MNDPNQSHRRVNLFLVGAQKAGTTALQQFLSAQPGVFSPRKEMHFFDFERRYRGGAPEAINGYHAAYAGHEQTRYWADCTPVYMYWPVVAQRLAQYNPAARILVLLRDPADRAISHWNMDHRRDVEPKSLLSALCCEPFRRWGRAHRTHSYLQRGYYCSQLDRLCQFFPRDQILLLRMDDLFLEPERTGRRVLEFLDLPVPEQITIPRVHVGLYEQPNRLLKMGLKLYFWPERRRLKKQYGIGWA